MKINCRECGDETKVMNLGPVTRQYCRECADKLARDEEENGRARVEAEKNARYRQLILLAQMTPKWKDVTFDSSSPDLNPRAYKQARRYAERFNPKSSSLILYSAENGTGKTHLAACIANHVLHVLRQPVIFKKARDLMLELRRTFSDSSAGTEADIIDRIANVSLLVLDDVGHDPTSDWLQATYWNVFDRRLELELPVVITTNKSIEPGEGIDWLGNRIGSGALSRLLGLCQGNIIQVTGPDLR